MMTKKIAIIVENSDGKVKPVTHELLSMAKKIHTQEPCKITFFIIGEKPDKLLQCINTDIEHDIYAVTTPGIFNYNGCLYKDILTHLLTKDKFDYICAPHSTSGMDYAPALSIALEAACITGVEDLFFEDGRICFVRSMFGGKLSAKFIKGDCPVVLTLQPGSFKPSSMENTMRNNANPGKVTRLVHEYRENKMIFTGTKVSPFKGEKLAKADVIISGGRGIGDAKNYSYIERMANLFPRSATGASRPICDYGWVNYSKQVGITGTLVSPKLYIACGISGANQHFEGIKDSKFIIAINTDPKAPIFQVADVCIVEDTIEFIELFIEKFKTGNAESSILSND
jgi:electron transfer flavoprotein alpha subunit